MPIPPLPLRAVVPAALQPFRDDLSLDREGFRRHVEGLAAIPGVTAILVNGEAAQASALSLEERRTAIADAVAAIGGRCLALAGVGSGESDDVEAQARDAQREGAAGLLVFPPPKGELPPGEAALDRFRRVAAASRLPAVAFQQKVGQGPGYATPDLLRIAALPAVAAVKEGSGDPLTFERHLRAIRAIPGKRVAVWTTHSRWLLADLAVGADGVVSGMGSVAADLHAALAEAAWRGDLAAARAANDRLHPLVEIFYAPGINAHTRMKAALALRGVFASGRVRPPLRGFPAADLPPLRSALGAAGWLPSPAPARAD